MGDPADVSLAATGLPNSADAQTNAPAQRHRGLADNAQDGLAAVFTAGALSWPPGAISPVQVLNQVVQLVEHGVDLELGDVHQLVELL